MDNNNQQSGSLRAIATRAWSYTPVRVATNMAGAYAAFVAFMSVLAIPFALTTMQHFNDVAEGFRPYALEVAAPAEGQCLYVDPLHEQKIVFNEPQRPLPLRMVAMLLPFMEMKGFNTYDLGRMPVIETAACDVLRPEAVISTDQAAALKRDAFTAIMQGAGMQEARDKARHRGMLDVVIVPR